MSDINIQALLRGHLRIHTPYASARDEFRGEASLYLDANESPFPGDCNRYPDGRQERLRQVVAGLKGIKPEQCLVTHGSDEAIDLLIRAFCVPGVDHVIIPQPTYGMYATSARVNDVEVRAVDMTPSFQLDLAAITRVVTPQSKLLFLCSPNNPTGDTLNRSAVISLLKSFPGLVIMDEAYLEFSEGRGWVHGLRQHKNLVVLQTFSKAWGLAGLRAGVCMANPEVIQSLFRIKPPYNIGALTERRLIQEITRRRNKVKKQVQLIRQEREKLRAALLRVPSIRKVYPSRANFLLVQIPQAASVYKQLLEKGIVVRLRTGIPHAGDCLRITVGTPRENQKLITVLRNL